MSVAACGSSNNNSSSSSSSGTKSTAAAADSGTAALQKIVDAHKTADTIGPTDPITKPIPKNKSIVYVNCGAPACVTQGQALTAAGKALGWKVSTINAQPTPQAVQAAFDEVIRRHPDGTASAGLGRSLYPKQIDKMNKLGIAVFSAEGEQESGEGGIELDPVGPKYTANAMRYLADKAIVDIGGQGEVADVLLGGFPIVKKYTQGWKDEMTAKCPKCTQKELVVQPTSLGKDAPQLVANFLRANPKIKAIYLSYDLIGSGLPAAAKGAGVTVPKTYSWGVDTAGIRAVQTGERTASAPDPFQEVGWQLADGFARKFAGMPVSGAQKFQNAVVWSKDFGNVPASGNPFPPVVKDYQAQFKKLWGVK
jgi:ribose transport system substrate-binding protein